MIQETYATVGTVSASPALGSLVHLDALDDQVASVETLGVGVGLGVLQEIDEELGGLDGPAGLANTELLAWGGCQKKYSTINSILQSCAPKKTPTSFFSHTQNK
jgi:hypothetical protein